MYYIDNEIETLHVKHVASFEKATFLGVNNFGFLVQHVASACYLTSLIPFGDRFAPMMCTGKHDKNKKLIYSGDIIMGISKYKRTVELIDGCWSVKCTKGGFFEDRDYSLPLWDALDPEEDEIIGNKFEQPELLEVKA